MPQTHNISYFSAPNSSPKHCSVDFCFSYRGDPLHHESMEQDMVVLVDQGSTTEQITHLIIFYRPPKRPHKDSQEELIWSLILIIGHESRFFVVARRILKRSCGKGDIWKPSSLRSRWGERYPGVGWLVWKLEADNQYIGRGSHHNMQPATSQTVTPNMIWNWGQPCWCTLFFTMQCFPNSFDDSSSSMFEWKHSAQNLRNLNIWKVVGVLMLDSCFSLGISKVIRGQVV